MVYNVYMKISYVGLNKDKQDKIKKDLGINDVFFYPSLKDVEDTDILSVFVDTVVSKVDIDKMPSLKMIATRSTGHTC